MSMFPIIVKYSYLHACDGINEDIADERDVAHQPCFWNGEEHLFRQNTSLEVLQEKLTWSSFADSTEFDETFRFCDICDKQIYPWACVVDLEPATLFATSPVDDLIGQDGEFYYLLNEYFKPIVLSLSGSVFQSRVLEQQNLCASKGLDTYHSIQKY